MTIREYIEQLNQKIEEATSWIDWALDSEDEILFKKWSTRKEVLLKAYNNIFH